MLDGKWKHLGANNEKWYLNGDLVVLIVVVVVVTCLRTHFIATYIYTYMNIFLLEYKLRAERYRKTTLREWKRERAQSYVSQYLTFSEHSTEPTADVSEVIYTKAFNTHTYTNDVIASHNNNRQIKRERVCLCLELQFYVAVFGLHHYYYYYYLSIAFVVFCIANLRI